MHKAFCTMSTETFLNWLWPGWTATLFLCYCWASLMNLQSPTSRAEFLKRTGKCQSSRLIPAAVEHVQQACGCVMFDWLNTSALCRGHRSNQVRFWWSLKSPIICQSNEKFVTFHFERHFLFCCKCLRGFSFVQSRNYVQTSEVLISRWGTWGFSALDYCRPLSGVLNLANMFELNVMTNILQTVVESWHLHCYPVNGWLSFSIQQSKVCKSSCCVHLDQSLLCSLWLRMTSPAEAGSCMFYFDILASLLYKWYDVETHAEWWTADMCRLDLAFHLVSAGIGFVNWDKWC